MENVKKTQLSSTLQKIAAIIYSLYVVTGILFNYSMLARNYELSSWTLANIVNILIIFAAGALATWLFATQKPISPFMRKALMAQTVFICIYEIISYSQQAFIINQSLAMLLPNAADKIIAQLICVCVRVLLLILGVFFVISAEGEQNDKTAQAEIEEDASNEQLNAEESLLKAEDVSEVEEEKK